MTNHPCLHQLAEFAGVLTGYHDINGHFIAAKPEILMTVLRALGIPITDPESAPQLLAQIRLEAFARPLEPVMALPHGNSAALELRHLEATGRQVWDYHLQLESGEILSGQVNPQTLPLSEKTEQDKKTYFKRRWQLPHPLECGYHRLHLQSGNSESSSLLMVYPSAAALPRPNGAWGIFCPAYALHDAATWGIGDIRALGELAEWIGSLGGSYLSTLPLLPLSNRPGESPSPYSAQSRFFWEEIYLDPRLQADLGSCQADLGSCQAARDLLQSESVQNQIKALQAASHVDYPAVRNLKRGLWEEVLRCVHQAGGEPWRQFESFVKQSPLLQAYARFRAGPAEPSATEERYHQFVQWLAHRQMERLVRQSARQGVQLALDYPLGVHPEGFDCHYFKDLFPHGISTGAPPDFFFREGQNWGFPPPHPLRFRESGYDYLRRSLSHHLRFGKMLRIDHMMAAHRLFWIPEGASAREGVYVRYPAEEYYAVLNLEAMRHQGVIVGEDLGTVPPEVRPAMKRHGILRTFVYQFEENLELSQLEQRVPQESVAALNTHDMPPFARFWEKRGEPEAALETALCQLAASAAAVVLINMEDLWLEPDPQNIPGSSGTWPNWSRKLRYPLEAIKKNPSLEKLLKRIQQIRHNTKKPRNEL